MATSTDLADVVHDLGLRIEQAALERQMLLTELQALQSRVLDVEAFARQLGDELVKHGLRSAERLEEEFRCHVEAYHPGELDAKWQLPATETTEDTEP